MAAVRDASSCFVCGRDNPIGLHVAFRTEDGRVVGEFTPSALHVGFAGIVHGGILAAVLDDAMAALGYMRGEPTVTARLAVRYRRPARPGEPLRVEASETGRRGALQQARAVLRAADGAVVAEAEGTLAARVPAEG
ncbi:MAG: PaaI family thioesterase [Armatimonadota bacterium]|nr:PaaI family thioesterase [Armatimonadota bacterium]MDR7454693.1 PaaI family thioesterase [Armatimonadota bacterium]MDR7456328.1 PaaI family thioesterase [Armatimonadota bacterium]MDR7496732.1 PaaI family thioesterase [Armatimonadota bacterium]